MVALPNLVGLEGIIESRPDYRDGRPYIAGTGVSVGRIGVLYKQEGMSAEEIAEDMSISVAQAHAALAYYLRNREAIDADLIAQDEEYMRLAAKYGRKGSHTL